LPVLARGEIVPSPPKPGDPAFCRVEPAYLPDRDNLEETCLVAWTTGPGTNDRGGRLDFGSGVTWLLRAVDAGDVRGLLVLAVALSACSDPLTTMQTSSSISPLSRKAWLRSR
jgi:hypothetical protein